MIERFRIKYEDPETLEIVSVTKEFEWDQAIPAKTWAEDWAYAQADKGWFSVEEACDK